jgi:hypothetical protein
MYGSVCRNWTSKDVACMCNGNARSGWLRICFARKENRSSTNLVFCLAGPKLETLTVIA